MSWNNNYQNRRSNSYGSFNNGQARQQWQQRPKKKHSGCTFGYSLGDAERPYVRGWKFTKRYGLITYFASPYKKTKEHVSGTGKVWENWFLTIQLSNGAEIKKSCLYDVQKKKVLIPDLGFVMNPSAPNGGYIGTFKKRN